MQENKDDDKAAKRIRALFFLATPHQNASATDLHQKIILAFTRPRNKTSRSLGQMQVTNENFAELQSEISLWSFYETIGTELDDTTALVLEKAYAILGILVFACSETVAKKIQRPHERDHMDLILIMRTWEK